MRKPAFFAYGCWARRCEKPSAKAAASYIDRHFLQTLLRQNICGCARETVTSSAPRQYTWPRNLRRSRNCRPERVAGHQRDCGLRLRHAERPSAAPVANRSRMEDQKCGKTPLIAGRAQLQPIVGLLLTWTLASKEELRHSSEHRQSLGPDAAPNACL